MELRRDIWGRLARISIAATAILFLLLWLRTFPGYTVRIGRTWLTQTGQTIYRPHDEVAATKRRCPAPAQAEDIVVTVKTGASEAEAKLPVQLATTLKCSPNALFFSDLEASLDNRTLYDALAAVPESVKAGNPEFELYRQQQDRLKEGLSIFPATAETKKAAWTLDKYKNLHIIEKSYELMPGKKWYFNVDADTYIVWPSLLWLLRQFDPSKPLYTGSLTCFANVKAAHGGSGILMSEPAVRALVRNGSTIPAWDADARLHCCGDELVARALKDNGIIQHNSWPLINGDTPFTIPFGPSYWCEPVATMHHLSASEMQLLDKFEKARATPHSNVSREPLTYAELFTNLIFDVLPENRFDDWDNQAQGTEVAGVESFDQCVEQCDNNDSCFQACYDGTTCMLGTQSFRMGVERKPEDGKRWQSKWNKKRIRDFVVKHNDCSGWKFAFKDAFVCGGGG